MTSFSITLAVRRWIAAQIQWKIEAPRKNVNKVVPPVENAPDDDEARRAEIHAGSRTEREDSEAEERPYGPWAQPRDLKEEDPLDPPTEHSVHLPAATPSTTRARAAQEVEESQPISATRSKKRKRQASTSNLTQEDPPSLPVEQSVRLPTAIPHTARARAAQPVKGSQPISAVRSKKRKHKRPSTSRSKAPKVSTTSSQHEDASEQHIPTHAPDIAIDPDVAISSEWPPTEVAGTNLSETTNGDRVGYRSRVELIPDNPPSISSFQTEASFSQQGEDAVLCEPSPTPSLILVGHNDMDIEDEVIFAKEVPVLPRVDEYVAAVDAQDHIIILWDTPRASSDLSASTTSKPTEYSNSSRRRALVASEDGPTLEAEPDATQAFLEEIARGTHTQSPSRTGTKNQITQSDAMMPAPLPPMASPITCVAMPRFPMPEPEPLKGPTRPSILASPVLNPQRDPRGFAKPESQRPASHPSASQPPPSNLKFPPGSSKAPRRCSQCDHSLDGLVDIMTDSGGFAQWKKKCTYCRREVRRPKHCMCYRCQSRTDEDVNELPAQATPSTGHVDVPNQVMSSSGSTSAPVVRQLPTMDDNVPVWHGLPGTDEPTSDTDSDSMAFNGPASIVDARQQLATTGREIMPAALDIPYFIPLDLASITLPNQQLATTGRDITSTTYDVPDFNLSELGYHSDSNSQQNAVAGQATFANYQPNAPACPVPAPHETRSEDTPPGGAQLSVPSPYVDSSYLPTSTLRSRSISVVPTGNSKWASPVIPRYLTTLDDADWVIDERSELTRAMRQIQQNWGSGWRAKLRAGGVCTDSQPNERLAKALARLSSFEVNIATLLNSLQAFRNDPSYNSRRTEKRSDFHSGLFGTYDVWLKSMSATQFDNWRSFLSTSKEYTCHPAQ